MRPARTPRKPSSSGSQMLFRRLPAARHDQAHGRCRPSGGQPRSSVSGSLLGAVLLAATGSCRASDHPVLHSELGAPASTEVFLERIDEPGPIEVETVHSATWRVARAGLINLEHPRAVEAGLEDGEEPISIDFHVLRHPERGVYLVDTGVERRYRDSMEDTPISWLVRSAIDLDTLEVKRALGEYLQEQHAGPNGVLLTHLHLDHIMGMPDVPRGTPIFAGPGETEDRRWDHLFSRSSLDGALEGQRPIQEFHFVSADVAPFEGIVDVFRDQTLWALWVPGHTPGSVAYLARTPKGPVLITGDACHTRWGWEHNVEPGTFSSDQPRSRDSLARLQRFVALHPTVDVRLGHQERTAPPHADAAHTSARQ